MNGFIFLASFIREKRLSNYTVHPSACLPALLNFSTSFNQEAKVIKKIKSLSVLQLIRGRVK